MAWTRNGCNCQTDHTMKGLASCWLTIPSVGLSAAPKYYALFCSIRILLVNLLVCNGRVIQQGVMKVPLQTDQRGNKKRQFQLTHTQLLTQKGNISFRYTSSTAQTHRRVVYRVQTAHAHFLCGLPCLAFYELARRRLSSDVPLSE
jgi:hypothetical protein